MEDVLGWLGNKMSFADIIQDLPELSEGQILARLRYASNNHSV